ncbi:vesicle-associated membrane protein 2-like [Heptranchias perlo]|uniref:vesicle-associated membrane protein 2-like n=1 Tax=Heptranchias perlo TaxID=212740 RepID=UPI00355A6CC3
MGRTKNKALLRHFEELGSKLISRTSKNDGTYHSKRNECQEQNATVNAFSKNKRTTLDSTFGTYLLRIQLQQARSGPTQAAAAPAVGGPPGGPANPGDGGPTQPVNTTSNRRLQQTQAQVDEVVDIMRVNVDKVLERDQKLSELDDRADALQAGASQFETSAAKLKRKYWWKNCKMMIILGAICAFIIIVIISKYLYWNTCELCIASH